MEFGQVVNVELAGYYNRVDVRERGTGRIQQLLMLFYHQRDLMPIAEKQMIVKNKQTALDIGHPPTSI